MIWVRSKKWKIMRSNNKMIGWNDSWSQSYDISFHQINLLLISSNFLQAVHKAVIKVNEEGSEASAATGIAIGIRVSVITVLNYLGTTEHLTDLDMLNLVKFVY
jgi:serine protease inhibitor